MSENEPSKEKSKEPIPAYRDTFVHFLFGTPGNEPILLHFLNAVLETFSGKGRNSESRQRLGGISEN